MTHCQRNFVLAGRTGKHHCKLSVPTAWLHLVLFLIQRLRVGLARTVYMHRILGDSPAEITVHTPYMYGFGQHCSCATTSQNGGAEALQDQAQQPPTKKQRQQPQQRKAAGERSVCVCVCVCVCVHIVWEVYGAEHRLD
jgi:hypothetical protein